MSDLKPGHRGSTLPEALIALLVVSAGLPALALLQLDAQRGIQEAGWQLAAVTSVTDAAESLRAGLPAATLTAPVPAGLPPGARLHIGAAGSGLRVRVAWPGHDAQPEAYELALPASVAAP